jgi:hypothetical protein
MDYAMRTTVGCSVFYTFEYILISSVLSVSKIISLGENCTELKASVSLSSIALE